MKKASLLYIFFTCFAGCVRFGTDQTSMGVDADFPRESHSPSRSTAELLGDGGSNCLVYVRSCPKYPNVSGKRWSDRFEGANDSRVQCMARAPALHRWCDAQEKDVVIADFYENGSHKSQTRYPDVKLVRSSALKASQFGQKIRNLEIHTNGEIGIDVDGKSKVLIENVKIYNRGAAAIRIRNSSEVVIRNVQIITSSHKSDGSAVNEDAWGVLANNAPYLKIDNVKIVRSSTGVQINRSFNPVITDLEVLDVRGFVFDDGTSFGGVRRGHCVQFLNSDYARLTNFTCKAFPNKSFPSDIVSAYYSDHVHIRDGHVDYTPERSSAGVIFEYSRYGKVWDVDVKRTNGPAFVVSGSSQIQFTRVRTQEKICRDKRLGPSSSGSLLFYGAFKDSRYNSEGYQTEDIEIIDSMYSATLADPSCFKSGGRFYPTLDQNLFKRYDVQRKEFHFRDAFQARFPFN